MECARFRDEVVRGLLEPSPDAPDGALEAPLAEHRAECAACRRHEEELRALWRDLGALAGPAPDPQRMKALEAALVRGQEGAAAARTGAEGMRRRRSNGLLAAGVAAALIAGGAVGFGLGRAGAAEPLPGSSEAPTGPSGSATREFLLLLHDSEATVEAQARVGVDSLVAEYAAWAGRLAEAGRLVSAEKLADDGGRWLRAAPDAEADPADRPAIVAARDPTGAAGGDPLPTGATTGVVSGFFLVRAASYEEALALAGESPHLRYGGAIEVREIDRGDR